MFSTQPRCIYRNNQLGQVICQLRFPEILTIGANIPVQFQEAIRDEYPQFRAKQEAAPARLTGTPGNLQIANQPTSVNYHFLSGDGTWRVNLTSKFISIATSNYTCWEDFAARLDKPLATFISVYKPAYFERVGLRYINFISRNTLGLSEEPFRELLAPKYLGILADEEILQSAASKSTVDAEFNIRGGCRVKIQAGPGMVKQQGQQDNEVKFIFDQDLYMPGKVAVNLSTGALETLHSQAFAIFRDAITDQLHDAMEPEEV